MAKVNNPGFVNNFRKHLLMKDVKLVYKNIKR